MLIEGLKNTIAALQRHQDAQSPPCDQFVETLIQAWSNTVSALEQGDYPSALTYAGDAVTAIEDTGGVQRTRAYALARSPRPVIHYANALAQRDYQYALFVVEGVAREASK